MYTVHKPEGLVTWRNFRQANWTENTITQPWIKFSSCNWKIISKSKFHVSSNRSSAWILIHADLFDSTVERPFNPFPIEDVLCDFTVANARQFYSRKRQTTLLIFTSRRERWVKSTFRPFYLPKRDNSDSHAAENIDVYNRITIKYRITVTRTLLGTQNILVFSFTAVHCSLNLLQCQRTREWQEYFSGLCLHVVSTHDLVMSSLLP